MWASYSCGLLCRKDIEEIEHSLLNMLTQLYWLTHIFTLWRLCQNLQATLMRQIAHWLVSGNPNMTRTEQNWVLNTQKQLRLIAPSLKPALLIHFNKSSTKDCDFSGQLLWPHPAHAALLCGFDLLASWDSQVCTWSICVKIWRCVKTVVDVLLFLGEWVGIDK